jgi:hypothetical protein
MDLFRKKDLEWLKEKGDEALNWDEILSGIGGKLTEAADGLVIVLFAKQLNKWLSAQLEDHIKKELHDVFDAIIQEDYKNALIQLADIGEFYKESDKVSEKLKPWLNVMIEIYRGVVAQIM